VLHLLCGSFGFSLSTGKDVGRGKAAYIWIFSDPTKAEPTLGGGGGVVVIVVGEDWFKFDIVVYEKTFANFIP